MNCVKAIKLSVVFIIFVILACTLQKAPATAPSGPGPSLVKEGEQLTAKEAWEKEWDNTLKAAKKEGSVIIYASTPAPAFKEAINIFRQKYGISLDVITGRSAELRGKLIQERTHGLFLADDFASGLNSIFGDIKPVGAADSLDKELILPEVKDPKVYYEGKLPWADEDHRVLYLFAYPTHMIGINSEMVKPGEIKSYHDLLDPKWKGKIIINDPTITGTPFNGFATLLFNKVLDIDFFRQLVSQQTAMIQDQRL